MKLEAKLKTHDGAVGRLRRRGGADFQVNRDRFQSLAVNKCFFGLIIRAGFQEVICLFVHKEVNSW